MNYFKQKKIIKTDKLCFYLSMMRRFCHIEEKMFYSHRVNVEISFRDCSLRTFFNFQSFEGDVHIRVAGNVEETKFFDP
jgi:hypothetical protein